METGPVLPDVDLPVRAALDDLLGALRDRGAAVLTAPPGSGKTTLVPLALLDANPQARVVVAQPRRIAARAAAARIADLIGEPLGGRVGYTVRGDSRTGRSTRVELVTTGVLLQRLQRDPDQPGVAAVVVDECHERHLETDLVLAFAVDARDAVRPDLALLAMSATADAGLVAGVLAGAGGRPVPVVTAEGVPHPLRTVWCPPPPGLPPPSGPRADRRLLDHVAAVTRRALAEEDGDLLVFLPGAGEIADVAARLRGGAADVLALHGQLSAAAQDAALRPGPRRRVVLASAVAESSLTVPGVRVVVDSGLARVPRTDLARGLGSLVTVRVSRASATQRAGRAARLGPGVVYRCWSAADDARLREHPEPEVAVADLTAFALHLACWGAPDGRGLHLPDAPPRAALDVATATLRGLGAVDGDGRATPRGRALALTGTHPRLARALVDGAPLVGEGAAAAVVALLGETTATADGDLVARWRALERGDDPAASARWRDEVRRLRRSLPPGAAGGPATRGSGSPRGAGTSGTVAAELAAATVVGLAFPERLARARTAGGRSYLMASGTAGQLSEESALRGTGWLAVAVADRTAGRADARIRLAVPADEDVARRAAAALLTEEDEVVWRDGDVRARHVERLGAIVLAERPLARPPADLVAAAVADGLRQEGLDLLRWTPGARRLRQRLAACRAGFGDPWPETDDAALREHLDLSGLRRRADLDRFDVAGALRALVPPALVGRLDTLAPDRVEVASGSRIAVDYDDPGSPALPVAVQEVFGWSSTPTVAGRPLVLRLLSPAGRPVAVTADLASFWRTGYPGVRAELRGRYPRHPWPDDPASATPPRRTRGAGPAGRR